MAVHREMRCVVGTSSGPNAEWFMVGADTAGAEEAGGGEGDQWRWAWAVPR